MVGKNILLGLVMAILLSGCSFLTVGYEQTYCAENGADYSDAGVCDDPWTVYKNRHALANLNSSRGCNKGKK